MLNILLLAADPWQAYVDAVKACGAHAEVNASYDNNEFDGLILCGGSDVHPAYYGREINGSVNINENRDRTEMAAAKTFLKAGKPILGICRGMQLLNVALGGTLIQHLPTTDEHRSHDDSRSLTHEVLAIEGGLFHSLYGERFHVNTLHHQAIDDLGTGLRATMIHERDNVIEGVEHEQLPCFGVQWHPERICLSHLNADTIDGLAVFRHFISLCKKHRATSLSSR